MIQPNTRHHPTWRRTLWIGAGAGVGLTFVYSSLFALYSVCRSSLTIAATMSLDANLYGTLAANAVSIGLASTGAALLLSPLAALLGLATAFALKWLDARFNRQRSLQRTLVIGALAALAFGQGFDMAVQQMLGRSLYSLGIETYLFWFGLPGLLHIIAGIVGAWYFHHLFVNLPTVGTSPDRSPLNRTEVQYGS